ncbi:MAG: PH domain-containing protein [Anaerovoracaceae bacterium]
MANELALLATWTFAFEVEVPSDVDELLVEGEVAKYAYKTVRDVAVFTNKRLIVKDAQGITGKKIEIYSLPYSSINMWSTENAGKIDFNSEVELWTRAGHIKINLSKKCDIRKFDSLIANSVLLNSQD